MRLKQSNHAGEHAVFGSIEVLGEVKSKNIREIKRSVDMIQQETSITESKVTDYWSKLSDDGKITPVEKKILKKEWEAITQSYAALLYQAGERGLAGTDWWNDYAQTYEELRKYLFVTLTLFDDMEASTILQNRDEFNSQFSGYYYSEKMTQTRITSNLNDDYFLKILVSFDDEGSEGEVRIFHGRFYQYTGGKWVVQGGEYLGVFDDVADELLYIQEGQFFLASDNFSITEPLYTNGEVLYVNGQWLFVNGTSLDGEQLYTNGELLYTNGEVLFTFGTPGTGDFDFTANKLYYYENASWHEANENDWRYFTCMADYSKLTGHFPGVVQDEIINVVDESGKFNPVGERYLGISATVPQNARDGQFFVYSGTNHTAAGVNWQYSKIYKYVEGGNPAWQFLDATQPQNQEYYMSCLEDVLSLHDITDGYFATLFSNSFFGNQAALNSLSVRTITLNTGGSISSEKTEYIYHQQGLNITADGDIDANGDTHIGGECSITGGCIINGNGYIGKNMTIDGDIQLGANSFVRGNIENGTILCTDEVPSPIVYCNLPVNTDIMTVYNTLYGSSAPQKRVLVDYAPHGGSGSSYQTGIYQLEGQFGNINFDTVVIRRIDSENAQIILYRNDIEVYFSWGVKNSPQSWYVTSRINSGSKTLKFQNLPTSRPSGSGYVWNDGGVLKIS